MKVLTRIKKLKPGRIIGGALGLLLVLTLLVALGSPALAFPQLAHRFDGSVTIDGEPAGEGVEVSATIAGVDEVFTATTDAGGAYHLLYVLGDDPDDELGKTGGVNGDEIEFSVDDVYVTSYTFESGESTTLDLISVSLTFTITPTAGADGSIDPSAVVEVAYGGSQAFTITPGTGYEILDVLVDGTSALADVTIVEGVGTYTFENVTADGTIHATFAIQTFTITPTAGEGGLIDPSEAVEVDHGGSQAFTITPATDYEILDVLVDGTSALADVTIVEGVGTYTFENVVADRTIDATFVEIGVTYNLTVASTEGGSVTTPGEGVQGPYDPGFEVTLLAVPLTDYEFVSWTGDTGDIAGVNDASTTITMNANYSITANFALIGATYDLTVASTEGGSVTTPGEGVQGPYDAGFEVTLLAVPLTDYEFVNWTGDTGDIAGVNDASTTIAMNADYSITANFAEVPRDLGELIAGVEPGGTLPLEAGTYTGDVIIDEPITITGTEGETIIRGGITIGELTGSEVIIENLIITDYTAFGIRIVKVRDVDDFTIRNNTIQGVEESIIGIQVDAVEADGTLDIWQNTISGNEIGIKLMEGVAAGAIEFNNIVGNDVGLELQRVEHMVNASMNWWGDISGPEEGSENPGGTGDKIVLPDGLSYYPWLTREFQTVLDDNIAYFGYPMVWLYPGWNIMSTPIALDPLVEWVDSEGTSRTGVNTWGDFIALGNGLDVHAESPAYSFNGETQLWEPLTDDSPLKPCDAIYVRMASFDMAAIVYSPDVSVPSKDLYSGWNLISLGWLDPEVYGMPVNEALVTIEEVTGGLKGYKLVVSLSVNAYESPWIYIAGDDPSLPDDWMWITSGYWVFMLNGGTLAGFTFTPISLSVW